MSRKDDRDSGLPERSLPIVELPASSDEDDHDVSLTPLPHSESDEEEQQQETDADADDESESDEEDNDDPQVQIIDDEDEPPQVNMPVTAGQLNSVRQYDGKEDILLWIDHLEAQAVGFNWNDAEKITAVKARLIGAAQNWLARQKHHAINYRDWNAHAAGADPVADPARPGIKDALIERFGERLNALNALKATADLQQKEDETVDEFYDRCSIAIDRMNYTLTRPSGVRL